MTTNLPPAPPGAITVIVRIHRYHSEVSDELAGKGKRDDRDRADQRSADGEGPIVDMGPILRGVADRHEPSRERIRSPAERADDAAVPDNHQLPERLSTWHPG